MVINVRMYTYVQIVEDGGGASVCGCVLAWRCEICVCAHANQEKGKMKTSQQTKHDRWWFPCTLSTCTQFIPQGSQSAQTLDFIIYITLDYHSNLHLLYGAKCICSYPGDVYYAFKAFFEQGGATAGLDSRPSHNTPIRVASSKVHVGEAHPREAQCHKAFPCWS